MSDTVRWGILSTANIGRKAVTPAIRNSSNGHLVAVASRNEERAEAYAQEFDMKRAHGSYEALLADGEVDAVYIPLPNSMHREWTVKAAEAGKHVLCEKPLGLTAQECLEMGEAAQANGVKLMEAFMYRFHPRTEAAVELVREGGLGSLKLVRSSFAFQLSNPENIRLSSELGGGSLMDVGCYCVNISRTLVGEEPVEAQAFAQWGESGVDEEMVATLRFPGGVVAQFNCALTLPREEFCEVVGERGRLELPSSFVVGTEEVSMRSVRGGEAEDHSFGGVDEYQAMVEHFAECVLKDQAPRYGAEEAAANLRTMEALYRSARNEGRLEPLATR